MPQYRGQTLFRFSFPPSAFPPWATFYPPRVFFRGLFLRIFPLVDHQARLSIASSFHDAIFVPTLFFPSPSLSTFPIAPPSHLIAFCLFLFPDLQRPCALNILFFFGDNPEFPPPLASSILKIPPPIPIPCSFFP